MFNRISLSLFILFLYFANLNPIANPILFAPTTLFFGVQEALKSPSVVPQEASVEITGKWKKYSSITPEILDPNTHKIAWELHLNLCHFPPTAIHPKLEILASKHHPPTVFYS